MQAMDDVLAGRNAQANERCRGPLQGDRRRYARRASHQDRFDCRRLCSAWRGANLAKAPAQASLSTDASLQARKDLTAMGLRYFDAKDYLEA